MTASQEPVFVPHAQQDRLATVAYAANDLSGRERDRAAEHLVGCESCQTLLADIAMISAAVQALPAKKRSPGRDFQLGPREAQRLAVGSTWRRLLRPFGGVRNPVVRPLAATLMTIGFAAFVLSVQPFLPLDAGGTSPQRATLGPERASTAPEGTNMEGAGPASIETGPATGSPADANGGTYAGGGKGPLASGDAKHPLASGDAKHVDRSEPPSATVSGDTLWPLVSLAFLGTAFGLLVLRRVALRIR